MKHIQHMIRKGTGRVLVAGMLIMSLMASMLPAYAMTGEVLGPETEGTPSGVVEIGSWDELLGNFASPDDSQVIEIPEGTTIALTDSIRVPQGTWEINGGGTLQRGDGFTRVMLDVQNSTAVTVRNLVIDGQSTRETARAINLSSGTLSLEETTIRNNRIDEFEVGAAIANYYGVLNIGNGCLIENNSNRNDEGSSAISMIHGSDEGVLNISGATIRNNKGSYAITFNTSGNDDNQKVNDSIIEGNQITNNDGGIKLESRLGVYGVSIVNNNISGNTSTEDGAAISINGTSNYKGNIEIGYDIENLTDPERRKKYHGDIVKDHYGRQIPKHSHGTINLGRYTSSTKRIMDAAGELFDRITDKNLLIRRLNVTATHVIDEASAPSAKRDFEQLDLFTDYAALDAKRKQEDEELAKEKRVQQAMLTIKKKFGKNAILKGMNLEEGATAKDRNAQIGGHKA